MLQLVNFTTLTLRDGEFHVTARWWVW